MNARPKKVKFTTNLSPEVIEMIQRMALDYGTQNMNQVIEAVVREKWEAKHGKLENEERDRTE